MNLPVEAVCARTLDAEEVKDLQYAIDSAASGDMLIVAGDWNARPSPAPNHLDLRRQTPNALRRDRNAYWKAVAEETEGTAACGATRKLYQILKSVSRR